MFPVPSRPEFPANQHAATEGYLRYEDITQDGRLIPLAIPPAMSGFWRAVLVKHPAFTALGQAGILPILTRLTISALEQPIRVDRATESNAGFEFAHDRDDAGEVSRLFMNVWCDVRGAAGRIVPRSPAGPLALAGQMFAEHTFTRPFGPPEHRRITRLQAPGVPEIPEARYAAPTPASAGDAPEGAVWLDDLAPDTADVVFTLDQTDSNQHVNNIVYMRTFLDAVNRRLAAVGKPLNVRSQAVDIAYRKPCFAGDRVRCHLRLFDRGGTLGAAGFVAVPGEEQKPRCYVRALVGA